MFLRSPRGTSSAPSVRPRTSEILLAGTDSPVRADSSTFIEADSRMRQSAGMASPASSTTTSPGTSSADGTVTCLPPRMTLEVAALISCRAARAFSAWYSCTTPSTELRMTTNMMMKTSAKSASPCAMPVTAEMTAAMISMITIGSAIMAKKRFHSGSFSASLSLLGPTLARRSAASAAVRPSCSSEPCSCSTSTESDRYSFTFPSWFTALARISHTQQVDARS